MWRIIAIMTSKRFLSASRRLCACQLRAEFLTPKAKEPQLVPTGSYHPAVIPRPLFIAAAQRKEREPANQAISWVHATFHQSGHRYCKNHLWSIWLLYSINEVDLPFSLWTHTCVDNEIKLCKRLLKMNHGPSINNSASFSYQILEFPDSLLVAWTPAAVYKRLHARSTLPASLSEPRLVATTANMLHANFSLATKRVLWFWSVLAVYIM